MKVEFEGIKLSIEGDTVMWCSDWLRIDELVDKGYLESKFHGPNCMGAWTFHLKEEP